MKGRNAQVTGVDYRIAGGAIVAGEGRGRVEWLRNVWET